MSDMLRQLMDNNVILMGIWETIYMTVISSAFAYLFGLPLGVLLQVTSDTGIRPKKVLNRVVGFVVNFFRSIPFIILMVAMLPVAKFVVGTALGNKAVIVMLVIAAAPYVARMVESSLNEVDGGVIEAAQAMGANTLQIIWKVLLPEARPSLLNGATIAMVTILGYSAMAATIGGTGLGQIAITYGHQRSKDDVIWVCVILMVIIVQVIQEIGTRASKVSDRRIQE
ncbi:MAG: methionine ABC transporter permease [Anaerovoracaceae bacterium]|nr:ABC transporter permease [Bacillota bacterium]MBQ1825082.1 ABC transporter permease [Bacillota bacterium]MBR2748874.1 ABC transporter permease [Bacillota bacterium]MEE3383291.1 methionine ABC transporter permease [Anaerovoracaceae bacterium]